MSANPYARRIAAWLLLATAVFIGASISSGTAADPPKPEEKSQTEPHPDVVATPVAPDETKPPVKTGAKDAEFVVAVSGNGKPIGSADVKIKLPAPAGELTGQTDPDGNAHFKTAVTGTVTVLVIAKDWVSLRKEFTLRKGSQNLSLQLVPQQ